MLKTFIVGAIAGGAAVWVGERRMLEVLERRSARTGQRHRLRRDERTASAPAADRLRQAPTVREVA
jgi:hypothetical protein